VFLGDLSKLFMNVYFDSYIFYDYYYNDGKFIACGSKVYLFLLNIDSFGFYYYKFEFEL
jgi:hypothetical protein